MQTVFLETEEALISAFDIPTGITALVGGGGKTTLMLRLARALSQGGARVIVTTTTHILPPEGIATANPANVQEARAALLKTSLVCFGKPAKDGKLTAPDLAMDALEQLADYVLVESDGAKQLPLKAPAEHEPVIPEHAHLVIAVAGLDGAGKKIRDAAFRPALYATLCGKTEDGIVSAGDIATVLAHPSGQRKALPRGARFAVLLNKADDEQRHSTALEIASALEQYEIERVVIAALGE